MFLVYIFTPSDNAFMYDRKPSHFHLYVLNTIHGYIPKGKPDMRQVEEIHTTQFRFIRNKNVSALAGLKKITNKIVRQVKMTFSCPSRETVNTRLYVSRCPPHDRDYSSATVLEVAVDRDEAPLRSSRHLYEDTNINKHPSRFIH